MRPLDCKPPNTRSTRAIVQHLRQRGAPRLVFIHVPNGGKRWRIEAATCANDLFLWRQGRSYFLELKVEGGAL